MSTNRKLIRRLPRYELTAEVEEELWLGPSHRGSVFRTREELELAWRTHGERVMARHTQLGRRVMGWWEFSEFQYPGRDEERRFLYERKLLDRDERIELVARWRESFTRGERSDIPDSLWAKWEAERRSKPPGSGRLSEPAVEAAKAEHAPHFDPPAA
jgi:hypothetical protein